MTTTATRTAIKKQPDQSIEEHPAIDYLRHTMEEIEEYVGKYSLADAIREGASATDQKVGAYYSEDGDTCAMTAALLAAKARGIL